MARNVDKKVYKEFRESALKKGINTGSAITEAMALWIESLQKKKTMDIGNLRKLEGFIKTGKKVRWSEEIDEIVYGGNA